MELLDFINSHLTNWEELLSSAPYYLKITHDDPYVMLKYQQFTSDMSSILVQQARGAIFRLNKEETAYIPVSVAMYKFFNSSEPYAAKIDWNRASVQEKVDGSLIKLGYDRVDNHWLVSTNGTIRAANADINGENNYGELFATILAGTTDFITCMDKAASFLVQLDPHYCYSFELVSPQTRIVCRYPNAIYYLGRRNMDTFEEDFKKQVFPCFNIKYPRRYALATINDCLSAAQNLEENAEGFVVCDALGRRIKIKSPWYLAMHHLRGEGRLTIKVIVDYWQRDLLDDYIGQYPEYYDAISKVLNYITETAISMDKIYGEMQMIEDRKEFAHKAFLQPSLIRSYLFARKDNKYSNAIDYLKDLRLKNLVDQITPNFGPIEVGVIEDI